MRRKLLMIEENMPVHKILSILTGQVKSCSVPSDPSNPFLSDLPIYHLGGIACYVKLGAGKPEIKG